MPRLWLLAEILLAAALIALSPAHAQRGDVIDVPNQDAAMAAAQAKARASLAELWKSLEKPGPGEQGHSLKVGVPVGGGREEHIWVGQIERLAPGKYAGRLGNAPRDIKGKKAGDRIEFGDAQISDWMFMRKGKIVGNETMRPLLARMPKAEADKYRAMLEKQ
jgi:uncharacterized protein YegJ (DUF2314 family)